MVAAVLGAFEHQGSAGATIGVVTNLFNEAAETALGSPVSNRWVGHFIRSKLGLQTKKSQGVYAVPLTDRPRVIRLAERYGLSIAAECSPDAQSTASAGEPVT